MPPVGFPAAPQRKWTSCLASAPYIAIETSALWRTSVIQKDGRETSVRQELGETYSAIEEAKADLMGLFMVQRFIDGGEKLGLSDMFPASLEARLYATYLASSFRTLRFGIEEAHARSMAMQVAAFMEDGAVSVTPAGTFSVDAARMKASVTKLLGRLLVIQATGDRDAARDSLFLEFSRIKRTPCC